MCTSKTCTSSVVPLQVLVDEEGCAAGGTGILRSQWICDKSSSENIGLYISLKNLINIRWRSIPPKFCQVPSLFVGKCQKCSSRPVLRVISQVSMTTQTYFFQNIFFQQRNLFNKPRPFQAFYRTCDHLTSFASFGTSFAIFPTSQII